MKRAVLAGLTSLALALPAGGALADEETTPSTPSSSSATTSSPTTSSSTTSSSTTSSPTTSSTTTSTTGASGPNPSDLGPSSVDALATGPSQLQIDKQVIGDASSGFEVTVTCDASILDTSGGTTTTFTVTFDAFGDPTSANAVEVVGAGRCTVTETEQGGAYAVAYTCDALYLEDPGPDPPDPQDACSASSDEEPVTVTFPDPTVYALDVTVVVGNLVTPPTLAIQKSIVGEADDDALFVVEVTCADAFIVLGDGSLTDTTTVTFGPDGGDESVELSQPTDCTVEEIESAGARVVIYCLLAPPGGLSCTDDAALTVRVDALTFVGVANFMQASTLTVTKDVLGTAPPRTTFTVSIECDEPVLFSVGGSGLGITDTATVTFDEHGDPTSTSTFLIGTPELEIGDDRPTCAVIETDPSDPLTTSYTCTAAFSEAPDEPADDPQDLCIEGFSVNPFLGVGQAQPQEFTVPEVTADVGIVVDVHNLAGPALVLAKSVQGDTDPESTFEIEVSCADPVIDDGTGGGVASTVVTFDADGAPTGDPLVLLHAPSDCTVNELATGGAQLTLVCDFRLPGGGSISLCANTDFSPPLSLHVDDSHLVLMLNVMQASTLTVTKEVTGTAPAGAEFEVSVACDSPTLFNAGVFLGQTATVTFDANGDPTSDPTFVLIGSGACGVFETEAGGAQTTTYECRAEATDPDPPADAPDPQEACLGPHGGAPIAFAVPDLEDPTLDVTIGVTNVIVPSDLLSVDVETLGPVPPGSEFEVTIDCDDEVLVTPSGMTTTTVHRFDSGGTLLDPLPLIAGVATCTVEETETAAALAVRYSTSGAGGTASGDVSASEIEAPPTLQVDSAGAPTTVVVTNVYGEVPLSITKTVSGPAPPGTTFEITVMCASPSASPILAGSGELVDQIVLRYNGSGQPIGHDGVVWTFGAGTCTITERDHGGAASFAYSCNQLFTDLGAAASCDPDPRTSPVVVRVDRSVASVDVEVASTFVAREQVAPSTPAARSAVATPLDAMPRFAG